MLYSGGLTLQTIFGMDLKLAVWIIGIIAALYTAYGGLRAVVWADLKLLIPFIVVFPGIMAFQLYKGQMAITFIGLILAMTIVTLLKPLKEPKVLPTRVKIDLKPAPSVVWLGLAIIMATITLYIIFW